MLAPLADGQRDEVGLERLWATLRREAIRLTGDRDLAQDLVQDSLPAADSGVGTAIAGVSMQLTSAIAVTLTGVVMSHHVASVNPKTHAVLYSDTALTNGFLAAGAVGLVGILISTLMRHGRTPATGGMVDAPAADAAATGTAVATH